MQDYVSIISSVGFPIFIAMFVMIRIEKKMEELINAFTKLSESVVRMLDEQEKEDTNETILELLLSLNQRLEGKKTKT